MAKYIIDSDTLTGLADALREVTGKNRTYTPGEMIEEVTHILESATYILVDENGIEVPAVFVENEVVFDATANDIRLGKVAATGDGVVTGEKEIPAYYVTEGYRKITVGSNFALKIRNGRYAYTKMQALFCKYGDDASSSVFTDRVAIDDQVYSVNSTKVLATVTLDASDETIMFNMKNDSDTAYLIRYFTYKEEY